VPYISPGLSQSLGLWSSTYRGSALRLWVVELRLGANRKRVCDLFVSGGTQNEDATTDFGCLRVSRSPTGTEPSVGELVRMRAATSIVSSVAGIRPPR